MTTNNHEASSSRYTKKHLSSTSPLEHVFWNIVGKKYLRERRTTAQSTTNFTIKETSIHQGIAGCTQIQLIHLASINPRDMPANDRKKKNNAAKFMNLPWPLALEKSPKTPFRLLPFPQIACSGYQKCHLR